MASSTTSSSPGFQLGDIYYVLFRHKWKILVCAVLGFAAAVTVYKQQPPPYTSEAKLFIRFLISDRSAEPGENDTVTVAPDARGATVINNEIQIITSRDLSEIVAKNIGPEKILAGISDGRSLVEAASVVRSGLLVEVPSKSNTLRLQFQHPNAEIAQQVLGEIIKSYLKRHQEIHRAPGMVGDFLAQETDQLRARLAQTEEELRKINQKAGVVSLEASKQAFSDQLNKIRNEINATQIELAGRTSVYEQMVKTAPVENTEDTATAAVPVQQIETYQKIGAQLNQLRKREQDLLNYFKEGATRVQEVRSLITEAESQQQQLLKEFPKLAQVAVPVAQAAGNRPAGFDPQAEAVQITSLKAKIKMLVQQMEQTRAELTNLDQLEATILDLRRRKELEESNYKRYSASLEQSRIKEAMGDGKVSNISIVQSPTPAFRDWLPVRKLAGGIAASGLAVGLAWAFAIEMFLDRSLRRPAEVERLLHSPLFISIPRLKLNGRSVRNDKQTRVPAALPEGATSNQLIAPSKTPSDQLALEPFHQTLRDRLISYFDSINLRHKPKLIAVTGLGRSSGVTTTAAGLARSFSETGEGNVLLVDMTQGQGSAKHFQRGTQVGLDQLLDTRNSAFVRDNLYVVSEHSGGDRLAKGMPQRFNQLVPKLKASDFDYIIFDMPPVNQISITPRLAGFMDMTLLVVESEKTDRHVAERAAELLSQSKTNVGVVLNKNKSYVPSKLQQDHEFMLGM